MTENQNEFLGVDQPILPVASSDSAWERAVKDAPENPKTKPEIMADNLSAIKNLARSVRDSAARLYDLLTAADGAVAPKAAPATLRPVYHEANGTAVEGVFDGEKMIGPDGKIYDVPVNYASKSRLVEGDLMKLTVTAGGAFIYKQIKPADRRRLKGVLSVNETGEYSVTAEGRSWRVLTASVTYYKGEAGDQTVLIVPAAGRSHWGAVENIIKAAQPAWSFNQE